MKHHPDCDINVNEIIKAYNIHHKKTPEIRFGQYFMNIAYTTVHDATLFYETDMKKALARIYELYADPDGTLNSVDWKQQ